jgi:hypothetical protein
MITNSNHDEVRDLGYKDLIPIVKAKIQFTRMGHALESRTSYFFQVKAAKMNVLQRDKPKTCVQQAGQNTVSIIWFGLWTDVINSKVQD